MKLIKTTLEELRSRGHRLTDARKAIVEAIVGSERPVSAVEILGQLEETGLRVNKTTVYRELKFMIEQELVQEVLFDKHRVYYESALLDHHHHLVCNECGSVDDVVLKNDLSTQERQIENNKNFLIQNHTLEFFGTCADCQ